ncbi:MAG: hypothetical protein QOC62_3802, partial [Mycobacterium sp.]|nr:hypothetical protein [Mycobacterium sp.]
MDLMTQRHVVYRHRPTSCLERSRGACRLQHLRIESSSTFLGRIKRPRTS